MSEIEIDEEEDHMDLMEMVAGEKPVVQLLRKGEQIVEHDLNELVHVVEVYAYPHVDESQSETVDLHFVEAGWVDERRVTKEEFGEAIMLWAAGTEGGLEAIAGGPSYITLGGLLGSQDLALLVMGLGALTGWSRVMTPEALGVTGEKLNEMIGVGYMFLARDTR